jgi:hypothetical protein
MPTHSSELLGIIEFLPSIIRDRPAVSVATGILAVAEPRPRGAACGARRPADLDGCACRTVEADLAGLQLDLQSAYDELLVRLAGLRCRRLAGRLARD